MVNLNVVNLDRNLESEFRRIAEELMINTALQTNKNTYRFAEVEFYLYHKELHPDRSTHCNPRQLTNGYWYFHRQKNSIKQGKRKGIDITFGDKAKGYYAGILIRAMQNMDIETDYIYGPSMVADRIKEDCLCSFETIEEKNIFDNGFLKVIPAARLNQLLFACPRHNLGKNTTTEYIPKAYRFIIYANKTHFGKDKVIIPHLKKTVIESEIIKKEFLRKTI